MDFFQEVLENMALISGAVAWAIAQAIKIIRDAIKYKRFNTSLIISSGGFPSSHSSSVVALATSVGLIDGFNSNVFAISAIFSMVVMYDASGVRRAAGQQAEVMNDFGEFLYSHGFKMDKKLKELLGHTPFEVGSGAVLGFIVALTMNR